MRREKEIIKIAIVEDDVFYNKALTKYINTLCNSSVYPGYEFEIVSYFNAHQCIEKMDDDINVMVLDYYLLNREEDEVLTATDVIKELKESNPDCKVIVVSAQQSAHTTAQLMKSGIHDYVDKTVNTKNRVGAVIQEIMRGRVTKNS